MVTTESAESEAFTPEWLDAATKRIEKLRADILFGNLDTEGCDVQAEQFFLLALSSLERAEREMTLARIHQTQALASTRLR